MRYFKSEAEVSFSERVMLELLSSVCDRDEDPLDLLFDQFRGTTKAFIEELLRVECDEQIGFGRYERGVGRPDSRNGYYERDLESVFGLLEDLRIPRTRKNSYKTKLIERYQRRQKLVGRLIREMFVRGVSTRTVGSVLKPLLGIEPSATTVSRAAKSLDEEVRVYHGRPIPDDYVYLVLDGVTMKVKEAPHAVKKLVLCAYGITRYGRKEMIDFRVAHAESETCWTTFLDDLYRRGLEGSKLEMIVTDGGAGLIRAVDMVYPGIRRQRCWAHKARNVSAKVRRRNQAECSSGLRRIYTQPNRRAAIIAYREWAARWRDEELAAVECVAKDLEELLSFYRMPESHWKKVRTTNLIERVFREVRRRTRPMTCFANKESCERIIYAVFDTFNKRWEDRPIRDFTHKS